MLKRCLVLLLAQILFFEFSFGFTAVNLFAKKQSALTEVLSSDVPSPEPVEGGSPEESRAPSPPTVPKRRLDPLMASLTRMDADTANKPTKNVPFLGEIPADGSLVVLLPAAGIAVIGFVLSIVVAANSGDQLADAWNAAGRNIADQVAAQPNQVYDSTVCRGLCAPQDSEIGGLKNFMDSLRKD